MVSSFGRQCMGRLACAAMIALSVSSSAWAQVGGEQAAIPDPETIQVPTISGGRNPTVVREGWKHFYFYRPNTSYHEAFADFSECYRFLPVPNAKGLLPLFAPWDASPGMTIVKPPPASQYGLVGDVIGAMVAGPLERRARQSRMRRCMEPRGYQRFPVSEDIWEKIIDNYSSHSIAVQAKIVAMFPPDAEPLPVTP